jgi:hypothetical protein
MDKDRYIEILELLDHFKGKAYFVDGTTASGMGIIDYPFDHSDLKFLLIDGILDALFFASILSFTEMEMSTSERAAINNAGGRGCKQRSCKW